MRRFFRKETEETPLDKQIDAVMREMQAKGVLSEDYPRLMTYLDRLTDVKAKGRREPVSRDTLVLVAGNLLGILIIVAYEQKHVMVSRGFAHLIQPRRPKT